jgi:hypothetical protein
MQQQQTGEQDKDASPNRFDPVPSFDKIPAFLLISRVTKRDLRRGEVPAIPAEDLDPRSAGFLFTLALARSSSIPSEITGLYVCPSTGNSTELSAQFGFA